jgi:hypothetical protein
LRSSMSMGFQKPNNMQYRNLMDQYGETLMYGEEPSEIHSLVKLRRFSERIFELHSVPKTAEGLHEDTFMAEVNTQVFKGELENWRATTLDVIKNIRKSYIMSIDIEYWTGTAAVALAERFAATNIYSYQLGFMRR